MRAFIDCLVVALVLCGVCGCDGEVDQPLSDPVTSEADENLYGHWTANINEAGQKSVQHIFIGKHNIKGDPDSMMEMLLVGLKNKNVIEAFAGSGRGDDHSRIVYFSPTTIGKLTFMNVYVDGASLAKGFNETGGYKKWIKSDKKSCHLFAYKTDGNQLFFYQQEPKLFENLVKSGNLEKEGKYLAASSLVKHFKSNGLKGYEPLTLDKAGKVKLVFHKTKE